MPSPDDLTVIERSFDDLEGLAGAPFDAVVSNLGGLNCTDRLPAVARAVSRVVREGSVVVLVVMPPICPWELAQLVAGRWQTATRRLRRAASARVGGHRVPVWYHSPRRVRSAFGTDFRVLSQRSIGLVAPPLFAEGLPHRRPRLVRSLIAIEDRVCELPLLRAMGDFVVYTLRFEPTFDGEASGRAD